MPLVPLVGMYAGLEPSRRADVRHVGGSELLVVAVALGNSTVVAALLEDGLDKDGTDLYGNTPLHWAAMTGQTDIVNRLRRAGAQERQNVFFATPSDYLPRFGPDVPVSAYVQPLGKTTAAPMCADAVREAVGFKQLEHSQLGPDWFVQIALTAFDPELASYWEAAKAVPKVLTIDDGVFLSPENTGHKGRVAKRKAPRKSVR